MRFVAARKQISSVSQYIEFISKEKAAEIAKDNNADFLFRGQEFDYPLTPKLGRIESNGELEKVERLMFEEFKRCAPPFLDVEPKSEWEWLALAQHYGLPTRYLDWTYSALAALWFAVKADTSDEIEAGDSEYGAVFVFKPTVEDYGRFKSDTSPFDIKYTHIYRPPYIDSRIVSQQGVFTVHSIKNNKFSVPNFRTHHNYRNKILKYSIKRSLFPKLRHELNMLGCNASTQFPDLGGLCQHLSWRYFHFKEEVPESLNLADILAGNP